MTTYGALNGLWTAGNYDLNTSVLREEWGFDGIVMTDWWANINVRGKEENKQEFAAMVRAQNDLYMVCADSKTNEDNIMAALTDGSLTRGELQRNAANICRFLLGTNAMKRLMGTEDVIEVLNCPYTEESTEDAAGEMYVVGDRVEIDLTDVVCEKGTQHPFTLVIDDPANYRITITASSTAGELAQIPMTLFLMGSAFGTFTWNGTGGKPVSFARDYELSFHYTSVRLSFAQNGLNLHSMVVEKVEK